MIGLVFLLVIGIVVAKMLTSTYRFQLARMLRDRPELTDVFVEALGQNTYDYFIRLADLYDIYRVRFSFSDYAFRPSSSKEYSSAFYCANILLLAWWVLFGLPTVAAVIALAILIAIFEYISYWRDTFVRTMNNLAFQQDVKELYDHYKPTNRVG